MSNVLNFKMLTLLSGKIVSSLKLNPALRKLLSEGFILHEGCYFLKSLYKQQSHINGADFKDRTGYECFVNSIHFDDYVDTDVFEQALLFSNDLIKTWDVENNSLSLRLILSETDFGFNLKFCLYRENEDWIDENDVDKFEEALIIFNSCANGSAYF